MSTSSRSIAYLRCSTSKQEMSPDVQLGHCREYAAQQSLSQLDAWYTDSAVSGARPFARRTNACALLRDARSGDHIIVARVDRLGRNLADLVSVMQHMQNLGLHLHIVDCFGLKNLDLSSPGGKMVFHMMGAIAEFEREMLRQRVREANAYRRERGLPTQNRDMYGRRVVINEEGDRVYVANEEEQRQMEQIWRWRCEGVSLSDMHRRIEKLRWTTPEGRSWSYYRVRRVCERMRMEQELVESR